MEVSDQEGRSGIPVRRRRVRFTLPRQPRSEGDSRGGVGGHPQVCKKNRTALFNFNRVIDLVLIEFEILSGPSVN